MRPLTVLLHGGAWEGTMMTVAKVGKDYPMDIRIASGDDHESCDREPVEASVYRRHDIDTKGTIFMGSYKFTHTLECACTLVDYWL